MKQFSLFPGAKLALQHNIGLGGAAVVGLYKLGFPPVNKNNVSLRKIKATAAESDFEAAKYLHILRDAMETDKENLIEKVRGVYGFRVKKSDGKVGYWVINAKVGKGSIEYDGKSKCFKDIPTEYFINVSLKKIIIKFCFSET